MRILFVTGKFPPDPCGIGDQVFRMAETLVKRGHLIHVYTSRSESVSDSPKESMPGISIHRAGQRWDRSELEALANLAADLEVNVLHLQYHAFAYQKRSAVCLLPLILRRLPWKKSVRTVVTLHELAGPPLRGWPALFRRLWLLPLCRFSDAIVVSNVRDQRLLGWFPGLCKKRVLIPPASSIPIHPLEELQRHRLRTRWNVPKNAFLLVRFGFVRDFEASLFPTLLKSLRVLRQRNVPVHLLLVGCEESAAREKLIAALKNLHLADVVTLTGSLTAENVSRCLAVSDAAVQLYPEGACEKRSSLQAVLLHGLPTVSTQGIGVPPFFRHGETLYLVAPKNPTALANALEILHRDASLRKRLALGAAALSARFSWGISAEKLERLYASLLSCAL